MSYCRFGEGDVYVYPSGDGFICQGCPLIPGDEEDFVCGTRMELLEHLTAHQQRGHFVPERALDRLRKELAEASWKPC